MVKRPIGIAKISTSNLKFTAKTIRQYLAGEWEGEEKFWPELKGTEEELKTKIDEAETEIWKRRAIFIPTLEKWKKIIMNYLEANNAEIDKIWFDESEPYDCEIAIRLKNHKCHYECVSIRFGQFDGKLIPRAYDSDFGGGTQCMEIYQSTEEESTKRVERILNKIIWKKCEESEIEFYDPDEELKAKINIDDKGWILNK